MATNEILPFAGTDSGTNLLTQAEYDADAQRLIGNQPGVARAKLVNKVLRQASIIAAGLGKFIADRQANNVTDSLTAANVADYFGTAIQSGSVSFAAVGGSADALIGSFTPAVAALTNGMIVYFRAGAANATTTPTFTPNTGVIAVKVIEKGEGIALVAGDISGSGHMLALQYDLTNDKWRLLNPATPSSTVTVANDGTFVNNGTKPASTGWVRGAMSAIATAAGFAANINIDGYIKFPSWLGGWVVNWGLTSLIASGANSASISMPLAFPVVACVGFAAATQGTDIAAGGSYVGLVRSLGVARITIRNLGPANMQFYYLAVGK